MNRGDPGSRTPALPEDRGNPGETRGESIKGATARARKRGNPEIQTRWRGTVRDSRRLDDQPAGITGRLREAGRPAEPVGRPTGGRVFGETRILGEGGVKGRGRRGDPKTGRRLQHEESGMRGNLQTHPLAGRATIWTGLSSADCRADLGRCTCGPGHQALGGFWAWRQQGENGTHEEG